MQCSKYGPCLRWFDPVKKDIRKLEATTEGLCISKNLQYELSPISLGGRVGNKLLTRPNKKPTRFKSTRIQVLA